MTRKRTASTAKLAAPTQCEPQPAEKPAGLEPFNDFVLMRTDEIARAIARLEEELDAMALREQAADPATRTAFAHQLELAHAELERRYG